MPFPNETLVRIIIFLLGVSGFMVAKHIYKHKKADQAPLVCPVGFDCTFVVHSRFSEFMHIPLEIFGMIYYIIFSLFYLYFIFLSEAIPTVLSGILLLASFGTFLFSLYLLSVQIFILKKGCSWCIFSSVISILIFILLLFSYDLNSIAQIFIL